MIKKIYIYIRDAECGHSGAAIKNRYLILARADASSASILPNRTNTHCIHGSALHGESRRAKSTYEQIIRA